MKKLFIVANWKSNKTTTEAAQWFEEFTLSQITEEKEVIVCTPFSLLSLAKSKISAKQLPLHLGSQDFSATDGGAHTGEEPPRLLKEFIHYAIIGHSERRKAQQETDELIAQKIAETQKNDITPLLCVQGVDTPIPEGVLLVAYEPVFAIGSGHPDTPEDAEQVAKTIKDKHGVKYVLYGGSVTADNVHTFTQMPSIDGVLVGGASLDPKSFVQIINNS